MRERLLNANIRLFGALEALKAHASLMRDNMASDLTICVEAARGYLHAKQLCLVSDSGRGIWKRIDENRELLVCLQQHAPDFLDRCPWAEGWLASQDAFLSAMMCLLGLPEDSGTHIPFPRSWPKGTRTAINAVSLRDALVNGVRAASERHAKVEHE